MSRVRPILATLLLVAAVTAPLAATGGMAAPVKPADDPVVGTSDSTSRVLLLTNADAAAYHQPSTIVTSTLKTGYADFANTLEFATVEQRLNAANTRTARRSILQNATDRAAKYVDALQRRAATARDAYIRGDITAATYVRTLGEIHAEASSLATSLGGSSSSGTLYTHAYNNGFSEIGTRVYRLRAQLATVQGPVREQVATVLQGDRRYVRVHVTAGNGVMLSTIDGGQYVRETVRPDNADETLGGDISDAPAIIQAQYPWLANHSTSPSIETRGRYAFYYTANYGHGQISAYLDSTTKRVFVERHRQTLTQLPVEIEVTDTTNSAILSASRTYAGGPLLIRVETANGEPVDTIVSLNGTAVGSTGSDGQLWALSPAGDYNITATHNDATLTVNVSARPAPNSNTP